MSSKVKEINNSLKEGPLIIGYFMVGCHWCDELKPIWKKLQKKYSSNTIKDITVSPSNPTALNGLNCDTSDTTKGFPCICAYINGNKQACFKGNRTEETLTNFIDKYVKKKNSAKGSRSKRQYKTTKTKRKKRRRKQNKTKKKKKGRRRKSSKARSAFYKKLNKRIKKKKRN
uniref:Thioredoxin domain-containing protein n=1 Tax=viral metagenome TaxID=1070528 RepID=A0A6C0C235_9ZZZZ